MSDDAGKSSHKEVGYQKGSNAQHCAICSHFIPARKGGRPHCQGVVDPIGPGYWCVRFEPDAA